jgi:hypothetical protein
VKFRILNCSSVPPALEIGYSCRFTLSTVREYETKSNTCSLVISRSYPRVVNIEIAIVIDTQLDQAIGDNRRSESALTLLVELSLAKSKAISVSEGCVRMHILQYDERK